MAFTFPNSGLGYITGSHSTRGQFVLKHGTGLWAFLDQTGIAGGTGDSKIHIFKSTDNGASWADVDSSLAISPSSTFGTAYSVVQDGDYAYVSYAESTGLSVVYTRTIRVKKFNLNTGSYEADPAGTLTVAAFQEPYSREVNWQIARRGPGDFVVIYSSTPSLEGGYNYSRTSYATFDGDSFTLGGELPGQSGNYHYRPYSACVDCAGITHFLYSHGTGYPFDVMHVGMQPDGTFGTTQTASGFGYLFINTGTISNIVAYMDGATNKLAFAGFMATANGDVQKVQAFIADAALNPSWTPVDLATGEDVAIFTAGAGSIIGVSISVAYGCIGVLAGGYNADTSGETAMYQSVGGAELTVAWQFNNTVVSSTITGITPTAPATLITFSGIPTNALSSTIHALSGDVSCAPPELPPPVFLCGAPPASMEGFDYQYQLHVTGGQAPYTWEVTEGQLPDGLTLDPDTGLISGTLAKAGSYSFTIQVTDALGRSSSDTCGIGANAPPSVECGEYTPGYTATVRINYSISPYFLIEDSGPTAGWFHDHCTCGGFELINDDGTSALYGRKCACEGIPIDFYMGFSGEFFLYDPEDPPPPDIYVPHSVTVQVICEPSRPGGREIQSVDCNDPPGASPGEPYSHQIGVTGGIPPYTFEIVAGSLPPGLSMDSSGLITGTPTTLGTYTFTVRVTDADGFYKEAVCTITVLMGVDCGGPPVACLGEPYSHQLGAFGGTAPYTFELIGGAMPTGLSMDSAGLIAGVPIFAGAFTFLVRLTDARGLTAAGNCTITVSLCVPPVHREICLLLDLWVWRQLRKFTSLDEDVEFPPAYADALRHALAIDIAPEFRRKVEAEFLGLAEKMKADIAKLNVSNDGAREDPPGVPPVQGA